MKYRVTVRGLKEVESGLTFLRKDVADLDEAFGELGRRGVALARAFAPRRSGQLAASIRSATPGTNKVVIFAGGHGVEYARVIEYGSPARGIRASMFLHKADRALQPERTIQAEIRRLIRKRGF